jgi:tetratricopeptide (TPR) repeat protein
MAVMTPAFLAGRSLRKGRQALASGDYRSAYQILRRASRCGHPDIQQMAVTLMAESALYAGRPHDALLSLDDMTAEIDEGSPHLRRMLLLRGVACCAVGQFKAARRALEPLTLRRDAAPEEHLALAQACLLDDDTPGARRSLAAVDQRDLCGPLLARCRLIAAAIYWRDGKRDRALRLLPDPADCSPAESVIIAKLKEECININ